MQRSGSGRVQSEIEQSEDQESGLSPRNDWSIAEVCRESINPSVGKKALLMAYFGSLLIMGLVTTPLNVGDAAEFPKTLRLAGGYVLIPRHM
jgi:hypothetical protein